MSKWLTIPKNHFGEKEYNEGIDFSDNLLSIEIPEDEISGMIIDRTISKINMKCDIFIDDYENDIIQKRFVASVIPLVDKDKYPTFYNALIEAKNRETFLAVDL